MASTKHAAVRAQQRAIPPFVDRLLDEFGEEEHDGHGCIRVFFSHNSIRRMERALGHQPVTLFKRYLHAYKVESGDTGATITRGWRTARIRRR
jgi:hypothetical protein